MYGKEHGGGWWWVTDALMKMLADEELLCQAMADVLRQREGDLAVFWMAQFLWDVLYGAGCPFVRITNPSVDKANFPQADFLKIAAWVRSVA